MEVIVPGCDSGLDLSSDTASDVHDRSSDRMVASHVPSVVGIDNPEWPPRRARVWIDDRR
jgi:hypothetical protein